MLISELTLRVIQETGRPDLEDFITSIATSSLKQIHSVAKFVRDMVEETIVVPSPAAVVRLTLPPRFREFQDVAIMDKFNRPISRCEPSSPSNFLDQFNMLPQRPSYYVTGSTYTVMANRELLPIQYLYVTYYTHPPIEHAGSSTWILEQYPEMVIDFCNFKVHSKTGNDIKSRESYALYQEGLRGLLNDQPVGA